MAKDGLVSKLKRVKQGLKRTALVVTALSVLVGFASCNINPPKPDPVKNNPPKGTLSVDPVYGQAPLKDVEIKWYGEDADGKEDIINYKLSMDIGDDKIIEEAITQSTPIDITRNFYEAGNIRIYGEVIDSHGAVDEKSLYIIVSNPEDPTVDLSSIPDSEKNFNEEDTTTITLPPAFDLNPEDNPVWYTGASSLDGKVSTSLIGNQLTLTGETDLTGTYQVKLELENINGETGEAILQGEIFNLIDIFGRLEDNETDSLQEGVIRVYDSSDNSRLEEIITSGNFGPLQLQQRVSEVILQARIMNGSTPISYVRTIRLDGNNDYSDLTLRAVIYDNPDDTYDDGLIDNPDDPFDTGLITAQQFREHMRKTNISTFVLGIDGKELGLHKWNLNELKGIGVFLNNPISGNGSFNTTQRDIIIQKIKASDDVELYVEGKDLDNLILDGEPIFNTHYEIMGTNIVPKQGYIIVAPDNTIIPPSLGKTSLGYLNNLTTALINKAIISIRPDIGISDVFKRVFLHESKHVFNLPYDLPTPYDSQDIPANLTIMRYDTTLTKPGIVDKKDPYIVNETTYAPRGRLSYIMNLGFLDEDSGDGYDLD